VTETPLRRTDLDADPLRQFERWLEEARGVVPMPEAMALATASPDGAPSVRMVLLKQAGEDGLVFFTHYSSRKGRELEANPQAALLFYWDPPGAELSGSDTPGGAGMDPRLSSMSAPPGRQVRVEGGVERIPAAESDAYFATRPEGARAGAHASRQSEVLESREELERRLAEVGGDARPEHWGGFRLVPEAWEFWQHRDSRLHDRFRYRSEGGAWVIERLYP
jgi:pyridoxamine 5'-phosphate oxidase